MKRFFHLFKIKGFTIFVVCMILMGVSLSITFPFLSLYFTEELGISAGAFGLFMAISSIGGVIVNNAIAKKSDSGLERKWIIIVAMVASALSYFSYVFFHQFAGLLLAVTFFGGLGAPAFPQIFASAQYSANRSGSDDIIFAMSTLRSLFSFGFLIGPLLGTVILLKMDYVGLFMSTGIIFVILAVIVSIFLEKENHVQSSKQVKVKSEIPYTMKDKIILFPVIAFTLLFAINSINSINTPLFVVNDLGGTQKDVGLISSVCAGLEVPIMLILGALGKRISNLLLMISACFIGISYYLLMSFAIEPWQAIALQFIQAIFIAIVMGNGLSYFAEILPNDPGVASTYYANGQTIGKLIGTSGGGFLSEVLGFRYANIACIVILFVAFIALWLAKRESIPVKNVEIAN